MLARSLLAIAALTGIASTSPTLHKRLAFNYDGDKVYGVNLGGWFVLEPFITPSLFSEWANANRAVVDEYTYTKALGKDESSKRLTDHWNTWITQDDINEIKNAGLNHVRVPVGYWAVAPLDGDPFVQGQTDVMDRLVTWCRAAGIKILFDIHGAPGSQNGFDNSGQFTTNPQWQAVDPNGDLAKAAVTALAERYKNDQDVVTAIEVLNEPLGPNLDMDKIKQYYYDGFGTIRDSSQDRAVVIHDAFQDVSYWNGFMTSGFNNVMLDTHQYQVFSPGEVGRSQAEHISTACGWSGKLSGLDKWTIVGEWSGALTDCAKWLNGLGTGARYDGSFPGSSYVGDCGARSSGPVSGLADGDKQNIRQYIEAQLDAYSTRTGWIFWTWKTESAPEWNMQQLLQEGLFPQPLSDRRFPNQCS